MDKKQEVLVALGAAIGANCIPCFDHLYSAAKGLALDESEIQAAIETGFKVKNGALLFIKNAVSEVAGEITEVKETCCETISGACCGDECEVDC
ncbi:hypothetical protein ACFLZM_01235 [Thermodesulfobacteriota bacterium]